MTDEVIETEVSETRATNSVREGYRSVDSLDVGLESDTGPVEISGHFSTYDPYEIRSYVEGEFIERIAPGAFTKTFTEDKDSIRLMLSHGHDAMVGERPLGVIKELREDETGAYYRAELFDVAYVNDLLPALRAGQYGASFRFSIPEGGDTWKRGERSASNPDGLDERIITNIRVREVGPTVFGANPAATASVRSLTDRYNPELALEKRTASESEKHLTIEDEKVEAQSESTAAAEVIEPEVRHEETAVVEPSTLESEDETREEEKPSTDETVTEQKGQTAMTSMSAEERGAKVVEIDARLAEIDTEFAERSLSEDATVEAEYKSLEDERAAHQLVIDEINTRKANAAKRASAGVVESGKASAAVHIRTENPYSLDEVYRNASSAGDILRGVKDSAKRIIEERAEERGFNDEVTNLEKLLASKDSDGAVSRHIMETGDPVYRSAWVKYMAKRGMPFLLPEEARALAVNEDASGGYKVPFDLDPTLILTSAGVINPLREMVTVKTVVGKEWQGVTSAGTSVTRASDAEHGEGVQLTTQDPTIGQVRVNTQRVDARVVFSYEIDAADPANMSDLLTILREAKDTEEANAFVNGAGDGLSGVQGISRGLPVGSRIEMTADFTSDDLYSLDDALDPRHQGNAQFLARKSVYNLTRRLGSDSDGGDLWVRLAGANPNELIGYPARVASHMPAFVDGDTTHPFLILGDFKKYLIVDRIGMVMDVDPFVVNTSGIHTGQKALIAMWWNGGAFLDANAFRGLIDDVA